MARKGFLAVVIACSAIVSGSVVNATLPYATSPPRPTPLSQAFATTLSLVFAGDIMAHTVNLTHPPYSAIYDDIAPNLKGADLSFANLEFTIDPEVPQRGYPLFNAHQDYVDAAVDAGFRVFSVANNHIDDYGAAGIRATYTSLATLRLHRGICFSGIRPSGASLMKPETIEIKGWRIGFLAVTEFVNDYVRPAEVNIVDYRNPSERNAFLKRLKDMTAGYDLFILSVHGGIQYSLRPDPAKLAFLREASAAGATIVWGNHPHVLQPWEVETVKGSRHLIIYANGNLISGQTSEINPGEPSAARAYTGDSALFRVSVERGGGSATVVDVVPLLTSNFKNSAGQMVVQSLERLVRQPLPSQWHNYYLYRLALMLPLTRPLDRGVAAAVEE